MYSTSAGYWLNSRTQAPRSMDVTSRQSTTPTLLPAATKLGRKIAAPGKSPFLLAPAPGEIAFSPSAQAGQRVYASITRNGRFTHEGDYSQQGPAQPFITQTRPNSAIYYSDEAELSEQTAHVGV